MQFPTTYHSLIVWPLKIKPNQKLEANGDTPRRATAGIARTERHQGPRPHVKVQTQLELTVTATGNCGMNLSWKGVNTTAV